MISRTLGQLDVSNCQSQGFDSNNLTSCETLFPAYFHPNEASLIAQSMLLNSLELQVHVAGNANGSGMDAWDAEISKLPKIVESQDERDLTFTRKACPRTNPACTFHAVNHSDCEPPEALGWGGQSRRSAHQGASAGSLCDSSSTSTAPSLCPTLLSSTCSFLPAPGHRSQCLGSLSQTQLGLKSLPLYLR